MLMQELEQLKLNLAESELERELRCLELHSGASLKTRVTTDECELIVTGQPKTFPQIISIIEHLPDNSIPLKRIIALEDLLIFINSFEEATDKLMLVSIQNYIIESMKIHIPEVQIRAFTIAKKICENQQRMAQSIVESKAINNVLLSLYTRNTILKYSALRLIRSICTFAETLPEISKYNVLETIIDTTQNGTFLLKGRL